MKKLLLALTVLMLFMLVGCSYYEQGEEITPIDGFDVCYYNDSIWEAASDITCFIGEVQAEYTYELYIMRLAEITVTTDYHDDLEQILYDVLVIEYATNSCTREELNDYLEAYENEVAIYSYRIETLLDMIDEQLEWE